MLCFDRYVFSIYNDIFSIIIIVQYFHTILQRALKELFNECLKIMKIFRLSLTPENN